MDFASTHFSIVECILQKLKYELRYGWSAQGMSDSVLQSSFKGMGSLCILEVALSTLCQIETSTIKNRTEEYPSSGQK